MESGYILAKTAVVTLTRSFEVRMIYSLIILNCINHHSSAKKNEIASDLLLDHDMIEIIYYIAK